jgi:hypothetical protein
LRDDGLPVANQPPVCRNVFATRWLRESASGMKCGRILDTTFSQRSCHAPESDGAAGTADRVLDR